MKTFILLSGLPASGKDSAAEFFENKRYFSISFSKEILKPIVENTKTSLRYFIYNTIDHVNEEDIEKAITEVEELKKKQSGRELYITLGVIYLKKLIYRLSNGKYNHFLLFSTIFFEKHKKNVIASFRMQEELEVLEKKYPDANIIKILIKTDDNIRHERIVSRDRLDMKTIIENEKYERKTTYEKLTKNITFDYIIENNNTKEELIEKLEKIYENIN